MRAEEVDSDARELVHNAVEGRHIALSRVNTKVLDEQDLGQVDELVYGLDLRARRL